MKVFGLTVEIYSNDKINVEANNFSATTLNSLLEKKKNVAKIIMLSWHFLLELFSTRRRDWTD